MWCMLSAHSEIPHSDPVRPCSKNKAGPAEGRSPPGEALDSMLDGVDDQQNSRTDGAMQTNMQGRQELPAAAAYPNNAPPGHPGAQYPPPPPPPPPGGYPYGAHPHGMYPQPGMMLPGAVPGQYGWPPVTPTLPQPPPLLKSALLPTPGHAVLSSTPQSHPGFSGPPPGFPPLPQEPPPSGPPPYAQLPYSSNDQTAPPGTASRLGVAAPAQAPETNQAGEESSTRVVLQNLPTRQDVDFLQDRLRNHFPNATSVVIPKTLGSSRTAGHAYLVFATEAGASSAVALQNGLMMDGCRLTLELERNIPEGVFRPLLLSTLQASFSFCVCVTELTVSIQPVD